jgi:signal transduction histidine kinase
MAVTFLGLLFMQIFYVKNMVKMRYDQFEGSVRRSLIGVSAKLAHDETRRFLEEDVDRIESSSIYAQYLGDPQPRLGGVKYSFTTSSGLEADLTIKGDVNEISNLQRGPGLIGKRRYQTISSQFQEQYNQQKDMIDDVILDIISQASDRPISERADSAIVRQYIREELDTLGLKLPFEFAVVNRSGVPVYKTANFRDNNDDEMSTFVQTLFPNDATGKQYFLKVYFPTKKDFVFSSISFMVPSMVFTLILLVVFVFTIITAFRQKKLTEMKNDFINNMTHEFKTPISSISLAAQMLHDQSVRKSPAMLQQISNVIGDETKRLRFQVEKVLQMSMFEGRKATLKLQEIDANAVIYNIVNTFKLKVEKYGGKLEANLDAMNALVEVDEMHFTNVIFNLLDNAVKYRREDEPLQLTVGSRDLPNERLEITIKDNGIGIAKDDQKRIFEKFFRVSTGNRHDVKGFGLGLAYVKKMVNELGGEISVESQLHVGTKFIIILPLTKN